MNGRKRPRFLVPPVYFLMTSALIVLVARLVPETVWPPIRLRWIAGIGVFPGEQSQAAVDLIRALGAAIRHLV